MKRIVVLVATAVLVLLCAYFVWPTPWRYETGPAALVRIGRFTGEVQALCSDGWHELRADPFVDLADVRQLRPMCYDPLPPPAKKSIGDALLGR